MALTTRRDRPVAQPLLPLMQLAPLMPGKVQAPLHRQQTHALLGRPLLVSGEPLTLTLTLALTLTLTEP